MIANGIDELEPLNSWLAMHMPEIREAQAFTLIRLSDDPLKLYEQLAEANVEYHKMGMLLADAKSYLTEARAFHALRILHELTDLAAEDRKIVREDSVKKIKRLHDQLDVIVHTLKDMIITACNLRKSYNTRP